MDKIRIAVLGACYTRDIFNRNFIPNWHDDFEVTLTRFQNSIISLMSCPIPYSRNLFTNDQLQMFWGGVLQENLIKDTLNILAANPPSVLLMDFWGDVRGVFKVNECESYILDSKLNLSKENNFFRYSLILEKLCINTDYDSYLSLWKQKFDLFIKWKKAYLPETQIIINNKLACAYQEDGEMLFPSEIVIIKNKFLNDITDYACTYSEIKIIDYNDSLYYLNPNHVHGKGIVHFEQKYHDDYYKFLLNMCEQYRGKVISPVNSDNLIINSDFRFESLYWKNYNKHFLFKDNGILEFNEHDFTENKYSVMWCNDIELPNYNGFLTVSFECKIDSVEELQDDFIFIIRTFDKKHRIKKEDAVETIHIHINKDIDNSEFNLYTYSFKPKGNVISAGPLCTRNGHIEWRNIKINAGDYSPWNESLTEKILIDDGDRLIDLNRHAITHY